MILTGGRSGSSFLLEALQSHPSTLCFGEILEEPDADSLGHKDTLLRKLLPGEDVAAYCDNVVFEPATGKCQAVGFKVKYYHFEGNRLDRYLLENDVRIIHNKRGNLIAQSLSLPLAERHHFADYLDDSRHAGRYRKRIVADVVNIIERAEENQRYMARFDRQFKPRLKVLDVFYEDICHSDASGRLTAQDQVDRMLTFLGLECTPLRSFFARQRTTSYRDLIENYDELTAAVAAKHPEWESLLKDLECGDKLV